jgi:hypothetical protein
MKKGVDPLVENNLCDLAGKKGWKVDGMQVSEEWRDREVDHDRQLKTVLVVIQKALLR